jgi:hypothetical protein
LNGGHYRKPGIFIVPPGGTQSLAMQCEWSDAGD